MTETQSGQWPNYTYIVPEIYTRAKVRLIGLGIYTPSGVITNEFFAYISTRLGDPRSADDLERVTGLSTRHVRANTLELCRKMAGADAPGLIDGPGAPKEETLVDMAVIAARRALASAVLKGACACQTEGFQTSAEVLAASSAKLVLMVTAEGLLPNIMNVLDWKTSSLFGEGAAAFLLERSNEDSYLINGSDASQAPALFYQTPLRKDVVEMAEVDIKMRQLYREGKGQELNRVLSQYMVGYTKMNGKEVFREAPRAMAESVDALCRHAGLSHDELAYIVPHQANSRITRRMGELLINDYGWPLSTMDKLVDNFRYYGNLSNASIATAMTELLRDGRLHEGQWMALPAVGGGMNYGCWLLRFHEFKHPEALLERS